MTKEEQLQKQMDFWEEKRKMGRLKYTLVNGSIMAIVVFVVLKISELAFGYTNFSDLLLYPELFKEFFKALCTSFIGTFFGIWWLYEYSYQKQLKLSKQNFKSRNKASPNHDSVQSETNKILIPELEKQAEAIIIKDNSKFYSK